MSRPRANRDMISPGATIGILGSGQLGRMMAIAAKHMGYRVHIFCPTHDSPAGQVSDLQVEADFDDEVALESFARHVDVVTVETENIPVKTLEFVSQWAPAFPGLETLRVSQNRRHEKQFFQDNDIPTCRFAIIDSVDELEKLDATMFPLVLKTVTGGYDGKGQVVVTEPGGIQAAWDELQADTAIAEKFIEYDYEFSVIGARSSNGEVTVYPSIRNDHRNHILDLSIMPSGLEESIEKEASGYVAQMMERLDSVGVLTVEFFKSGAQILVNEIAPRPHNSGHLTIEANMTDQFEQHVRCVCGMALGSTEQLTPAAMANLLGCEWADGEPDWQKATSLPNVKLHLYGKGVPQPARKMGHITAMAASAQLASEIALDSRKRLRLDAVASS